MPPADRSCTTQVAFDPHTMSATVFVLPPVQAAGPVLFAAPQSLSVTRMIALPAIDIDSEKSIVILSPASSVLENPAFWVRTAAIDVGAVASEVPGMFTGT